MRIVVITSCTGEKSVEHSRQLTLDDFKDGPDHVAACEAELAGAKTRAEELYTGQQHQRLMRGVAEFRKNRPGDQLDLFIVSAGYGLVAGDRELAPYEATFQGMKARDLRSWADKLGLPEDVREVLASKFDLALVLLGDSYLRASSFDEISTTGGPAVTFCSSAAKKRMASAPALRIVELGNSQARRFSCGLVALKGELGARILELLAREPGKLASVATAAPQPLLDMLDGDGPQRKHAPTRTLPPVDYVISIPAGWHDKPHRSKIRYFIPEWDDLVDRDYDFLTDMHSGGMGDWSNEVYAHQLYPEPNYDGILISKVVAEKSKKKKQRINSMGVHRFLRVPREFPIMGDCGAFGYIGEKDPPYQTDEILDYYSRLDFDYGVSIDHLCVASNRAEWKYRYQLTIDNAADFLRLHKKRKLHWTPIGAVQGWDPQSYAHAALKLTKMGYQYIALGGLVRTPTPEIVKTLKAVHDAVPQETQIHLFGLARLGALPLFHKYGATSVDSASFLRRAWMGTGQNYLTDRGEFITAVRIPEANKSFRAKRMVTEGRACGTEVERLEKACLQAVRDFDAGRMSVAKACEVLDEYDQLVTPGRKSTKPLLERALADAPWKRCPCEICKKDGVEVIIFRGNNRNRRRGFHNTWQFYRLFQDVLAGKDVNVPGRKDLAALLAELSQTELFEEVEVG